MSAFLGPIHYWLYNKIQLQEAFTSSLLSDHKEIESSLEEACGTVEHRPLEEVIDTGNIHGWLQSQILIAEARYAYAVTALLKENKLSLEELKQLSFDFGKNHPLTGKTAPELYKQLQDLLLDGMPCDHVNRLVEQTDDKVIYERTADLHSLHWEKLGKEGENYYILRAACVKGMLEASSFSYTQDGNLSIISNTSRN